ncbi:MAG: methyl-accepting chemotaxis protein [Candidatus Nitrosocaldaceae archaeon]|nr:MAG: methyl-accepting chemotaxis protein [Candidatus Nitrosocaldaceae archaeon]
MINMQLENAYTLDEIAEMAHELMDKTRHAIEEIVKINEAIHMLSINALIEANRAGEYGRTFAVVAQQMSELNNKITSIVEKMKSESSERMNNISKAIITQATTVRGVRLSDLALTNIDIIDRNLYERSCDVRWWSKDLSIINALENKSNKTIEVCSERLATILDAYTVYFDLIVCDINGDIIVNGRPELYNSKGTNCSDALWFKEAMEGKEFGFQSLHRSELVNNKLALIYSAPIKAKDGRLLGVFATIFKWEDLASSIITKTSIPEKEKKFTRVCTVDDTGTILADSANKILNKLNIPKKEELFKIKKGFIITKINGKKSCVAHALSPGYETYATGWHSIIIQDIESMSFVEQTRSYNISE